MNKPISWFEIPALDLSRAKAFYETLFAISLHEETMGPSHMAIFPYDRGQATGGCVVKEAGYQPSRDGVAIYLNAGESLDPVLGRVHAAGGTIAQPKTALPPGMGFVAHIIDSEGNRIGIHAAG